jgi:hypothetical protein
MEILRVEKIKMQQEQGQWRDEIDSLTKEVLRLQ